MEAVRTLSGIGVRAKHGSLVMAKAKGGGGKLHRLPFTTFGDIAALGLEAEVHCSSCYRQTKVDPADRRLSDRVFAETPFRCGMRDQGFAVPLQACPGIRRPRLCCNRPVILEGDTKRSMSPTQCPRNFSASSFVSSSTRLEEKNATSIWMADKTFSSAQPILPSSIRRHGSS
jgi:hypothetical protein